MANLVQAGQGYDNVNIKPSIDLHEKGKWIGKFELNKYDFSQLNEADLEQAENDHRTLSKEAMRDKWGDYFVSDELVGYNVLLNEGINAMLTLLAGGSETAFNNANARIGVGDSTTAAAAAQTDLQAATNKTYKAMDGGYPTYGSSQQIVFRSTFASGDANYAWQEFVVDNGSGAAKTLNRLVSNQGTKASGQSWQITVTITIT